MSNPGGWSAPGWQSAPPPPGGGWPPPPSGGPPGYYGIAPADQKTDRLSIVSLVLGIASFLVIPVIGAIAAIITGVKAKKAIDESRGAKSGRGMATAGEVLGIVNIPLVALFVVLAIVGAATAGKHTAYTNLATGDCFNNISSDSVFSGQVDKVVCTMPHDAEVTGTFDATDPGSYPGEAGFRTQAQPMCDSFALAYVGDAQAAEFRAVWLYPLKATWDNGGREVVCAVGNIDGSRRTGSAKSS